MVKGLEGGAYTDTASTWHLTGPSDFRSLVVSKSPARYQQLRGCHFGPIVSKIPYQDKWFYFCYWLLDNCVQRR